MRFESFWIHFLRIFFFFNYLHPRCHHLLSPQVVYLVRNFKFLFFHELFEKKNRFWIKKYSCTKTYLIFTIRFTSIFYDYESIFIILASNFSIFIIVCGIKIFFNHRRRRLHPQEMDSPPSSSQRQPCAPWQT